MSCLTVIDTNVLVAALLSKHNDAATVQVLDRMYTGEIVPVYNDEILMEYRDVLRRPKFHFPDIQVRLLLEAVMQNGINADRVQADEILPDPKDLVFYEVVLAKQEEGTYLITGNGKHFPTRPYIVTPNEMLEILTRNE